MKDLNAFWKEMVSGKKILVTGGTTGIGREITLLLSSLGASCFICGRDPEPLKETIALVNSATGTTDLCQGQVADLSKSEDIEKLFERIDQKLGGLDVLVNNAALGYGGATEGTLQDISYIVQTNLIGYLCCSAMAVKRMGEKGKGHIINIGSMSADVREQGSSVYVATKAGIQGFSEALRKELNSKGIKVSLIEPGATDTDMQAQSAQEKRNAIDNLEMLPAEDIAMAVAFTLAQYERCDIVNIQVRPHLQLI